MKTKHLVGLAALAALLVSAVAFAEDKGKPADAQGDAQKQEQPGGQKKHPGKKMCADCKAFHMQMKTDKEAFHKQMKADKEAFEATLKDKKPAEKKAAREEFKKQQEPKREEFRKAQDAKRDEFKKNHKCACGVKGPKGAKGPAAEPKAEEPKK